MTFPSLKNGTNKKMPLHIKTVIIFGSIFFLFAIVLIYLGLFGEYHTKIFGLNWALFTDPGGWYLPSGIYFFRTRYTSFFGHPGLLLQAITGIITECSYGVYRIWGNASYPSYVIKNYPTIIFFVSILIPIFHLLTFFFLYKLSKRFFSDSIYPALSVIAYGTTFPTLLYINRLSPDPLCVFLIIVSVWALFNGIEAIQNKKTYKWQIILSAITISTACFSKLVYGLPAMAAIILYLVFYKPLFNYSDSTGRWKIISVFFPVSLVVMLLWSTKIDPVSFYDSWSTIFNNYSSKFIDKFIEYLVLHPNILDFIIICEAIFLLISIWGILTIIKNSSVDIKNYTVLIVLISIFITPFSFLKLGPNYLLVPFALLSIPFVYQIKHIFENYFISSMTQTQKLIIALLFTCCIHWTSIYFNYTTQIDNIISYRKFAKPIYHVLSEIDYGEKIAVNTGDRNLKQYFGITRYTPPELLDTFNDYFIFSNSAEDALKADAKYFIYMDDTSASSIPLK